MVIIAIGVEYPRDMTVQRPHDRDPGQHRWTTSRHQHLIVGVGNWFKTAEFSGFKLPAFSGEGRKSTDRNCNSLGEREGASFRPDASGGCQSAN
jgi:hypothetical protein